MRTIEPCDRPPISGRKEHVQSRPVSPLPIRGRPAATHPSGEVHTLATRAAVQRGIWRLERNLMPRVDCQRRLANTQPSALSLRNDSQIPGRRGGVISHGDNRVLPFGFAGRLGRSSFEVDRSLRVQVLRVLVHIMSPAAAAHIAPLVRNNNATSSLSLSMGWIVQLPRSAPATHPQRGSTKFAHSHG